jgi:predicted dehydrogenase
MAEQRPVQIAVVGVGSMGALHARVVAEHPGAVLSAVIDARIDLSLQVADRYGARASATWEGMSFDAAIVAVPTALHAQIALPMLRAGIPLLIEKPIAHSRDAMNEILATSRAEQVPVQCGFVERFNPVVVATRALIDGPVRHLIAQRHSPPADRIRSGVVGDLLIHDLDLALSLIDPDATLGLPEISGSIAPPFRSDFTDLADCVLGFQSGSVATLSSGRVGHRKVRQMAVTTDTSLFELDLLRQDLTVYHHIAHAAIGESAGYRSQTVVDIPFVRVTKEPLTAQLDHFIALVPGEIDAESERRGLLGAHQLAFNFEDAAMPDRLAPLRATGVLAPA